MIRKILPCGLIFFSAIVYGQEVISSQGDTYSNGNNSIDFTIGEPVIATVSDGTNDLTQGFHQTLLTIVNVEDLDVMFSVNIFPNPTSDMVKLNIEKYEGLSYQIFDVAGKLIIKDIITDQKTSVNVSNYPKGTYLLTLTNQEKNKIKSYKIIKK